MINILYIHFYSFMRQIFIKCPLQQTCDNEEAMNGYILEAPAVREDKQTKLKCTWAAGGACDS